MKENFLDECKEHVYEDLMALEGEMFMGVWDLSERVESLVFDDIIYYSQGNYAKKNYVDELDEYSKQNPYLVEGLLKDDISPYDERFDLHMYRNMLGSQCKAMVEDIFENDLFEGSDNHFELTKKDVIKASVALDKWDKSPWFIDGKWYSYSPDLEHEYENRARLYFGLPRVEPSSILKEAEETLGQDWKESLNSKEDDDMSQRNGLKV